MQATFRGRRGVTLTEVMVGVFVLGLTVLVAGSVFPITMLMRDRSSGYSTAATFAQRKLEQVRKIDSTRINYNGLLAAGVIDSLGTVPTGSSATFPFTTVDSVGTALKGGTGQLNVTGMGTDLVTVQVVVSWRGLHDRAESIQATTSIANKSVWREP
ncbi:MAG TPA: prepilin-type N-terminal cleavage/methylation domain-containing protein [Armatimonadota bacterium]|nr:prepilin-type N-terminal cleavage/methylation domain-containing protein [Armatimonadota bacterium]